MTLSVEHLPNPASPLCHWDARWKLAALILAALVVALLQTVVAALLALVGAVGLALLAQLPLRWFCARLGSLALALLVFVGLLPFWAPQDGPGWDFGPLHASLAGLRVALLL